MRQMASTFVKGIWTLGLLASLAVGVQAVGSNPNRLRASEPSTIRVAQANVPSPPAPDVEEVLPPNRDVLGQPAVVPDGGPAEPVMFGARGSYVNYQPPSRSYDRYQTPSPRRKGYRTPTCTPSKAQIMWARMLPNHDGLAARGMTDEDMVVNLASSEVRALDGDVLPEHLRPDLSPQAVFVNERCKDGTCTTGFCPASRNNIECKGGVCRLRVR